LKERQASQNENPEPEEEWKEDRTLG
jgi:hypothetical protein